MAPWNPTDLLGLQHVCPWWCYKISFLVFLLLWSIKLLPPTTSLWLMCREHINNTNKIFVRECSGKKKEKKKATFSLWKTCFWLFYQTGKSLLSSSHTKLPVCYRTQLQQFHMLFLKVTSSYFKIQIDAIKWHGQITKWRKIKSKRPHTEVHNHTLLCHMRSFQL